jgi:phosphoserine phosphatase RsbU/P
MVWPRTFKARILLLIAALLPAAAIVVRLITGQPVYDSMFDSAMQSSDNALRLMERDIQTRHDHLQYIRRSVMETRRQQLKDNLNNLLQAFRLLEAKVREGRLSGPEARRSALHYAESLRFVPEGYFFVYDEDGKCIGHVDPRFLGRGLRDIRDANGLYVVQELLKVSRQPGGGFVEYLWQRPGIEGTFRKLGYAIWYPEWKWMVGTGVYIDDVDRSVDEAMREMLQSLNQMVSDLRGAKAATFVVFGKKGEVLAGGDTNAANPGEPFPGLRLELIPEMADGREALVRFRSQSRGSTNGMRDCIALIRSYRPLGWFVAAIVDVQDLTRPARRLQARLWWVELGVAIVGVILGWWLVRRVTRPLDELTSQVQGLVTTGFKGDSRALRLLAEHHDDEIGRLALTFDDMQGKLQSYLSRLTEATAAQERIASELRIAREIQRGLLPETPDFRDPGGRIELFADLRAAREVGGDLYHFSMIDADHLALLVGDVTDKGVAAALYAAVTRTLIVAGAGPVFRDADCREGTNQLISAVNRRLCSDNRNCMFVTLIFGVLDLRSLCLEYVNAGHNPIYLTGQSGVVRCGDRHGPPLGIRLKAEFPTNRIMLGRDQSLFLYTDGITEACTAAGDLFGDERLEQVLSDGRDDSPPLLVSRVSRAVDKFVDGRPQSDDRAMLAVRPV